jgi:ATP-dependent helicase/nuclease subunit A
VRVMTIHQSKGLGFDVVVLPDLQSDSMAGGGQTDFILARDPETEEPAWALQMPRRVIADADDALREQLKIADETAAFDALCLLYVAMTRAKQGLYIITSFQGKTAEAFTPAAFLKQQLAGDAKSVKGKAVRVGGEEAVCLYEVGDPQWHAGGPEALETAVPAGAAQLPPDFARRTSVRRRLIHVQPSKRPETSQRAALLFAPAAQDRLELGTAIHELFERVLWIDEVDVEGLIAEWSASSVMADDLKQKAIALFRRAVAAPEIRAVLTRPPGRVDLWREKRFEVVAGNRWVSGAFDRVVVSRDDGGKPLRATIIDFKSDEVSDDASLAELARQYRPQMEAYRGALSRMLGLAQAKVSLRLVFVQAGTVLDLR